MDAQDAKISPFDRGFVFGDGVYEGLRSVQMTGGARRVGGAGVKIIGLGLHVRRMQAGLDEAKIVWDASAIGPLSLELLKANRMACADGLGGSEAFIYWQVTRGSPSLSGSEPVRSRVPMANSTMRPTVFAYCSPQPPLAAVTSPPLKVAAICRDIRWENGHLKSIALMGNVMMAMAAAEQGGDEAVMVRTCARGSAAIELVSEGLATNVVLVVPDAQGGLEVVTPSLASVPILAGVTRAILLKEVPEIRERAVRAEELARASEIMFVGTTTLVTSVTKLDGRTIGDGTAGPVARRLLSALLAAIAEGRDDL